jgi:ABC-type multidrug transport system fused ATPase/permease subunit
MINTFRNKVYNSVLLKSLQTLSKKDQKKFLIISFLQSILGCLDLIAVASMGILGALTISGLQSNKPGNRVSSALELLHINNLTFQQQVMILAFGASGIFILRTILSVFFIRKIYLFLSKRGAELTTSLFSKLISQSIFEIQRKTSQETLYALTSGVQAVSLLVLGTATTLLADISLTIIVLVGLFTVDPIIALTSLFIFGGLALLLFKSLNVKARKLGYVDAELTIESNEKILEVLNSFRELFVKNRRAYYVEEIKKIRLNIANNSAEQLFMPSIGKYVIESGVVLGILVLSAIQFALQDAKHAVAALTVFLAAGSRVAPAMLRIQHSLIQMKTAIGSAIPTFELISALRENKELDNFSNKFDTVHSGFIADIELQYVTFKYPNSSLNALDNVSLRIPAGSSSAIVGESGAGKTSLVDVLLGLITPSSGLVTISNRNPLSAISTWPGAISYVPQDIIINNGTIRDNVAQGYSEGNVTDELIWDALKVAQLEEFVKGLPNGLNTNVGERGAKMSGGQRQRLGIARAMFTKPKLLVLDESTSALDGKSEFEVTNSIQSLHGLVTVIIIAHRLSTIRTVDQIFYVSNGKIVSKGTFDELRLEIPDFNNQAKLMGL